MDIYLAKKDGKVIYHTDLAAMKQLDNISKADKTVTIEEWESAGSIAYIDGAGKIQLGEQPDVKAKRLEVETLETEEKTLQKELDGKDYKVWQAAERGQVFAQVHPDLHERRESCRGRINEIRTRLVELGVRSAV